MDKTKNLTVLISCYACGPYWGSEVGMGWNWIINLSEFAKLIVITEIEFKKDIEKELPKLDLQFTPTFHYVDMGIKGRNLFWKQGSFSFYSHYKMWQKQVYALADNLLSKYEVDIIHQLNLIGFREPGFLWKHTNYPFIWGPIGGINTVPLNYIFHFSFKNVLFNIAKSLINRYQLLFLIRVRKAFNAADMIVAESSNTQKVLRNIFGIRASLIHETGTTLPTITPTMKATSSVIKLIWIGRIQSRKALPIALRAIFCATNTNLTLTVLGDGPDEMACKQLAAKIGISDRCTFLGKISNEKALKELQKADMLFFTSLKEGTSTVVLEALSLGVPVLCHDTCGFGDIVNQNSGIKIPIESYSTSIQYFSEALDKISTDKTILARLAAGALESRHKLTWQNNAKLMHDLYATTIEDYEKKRYRLVK